MSLSQSEAQLLECLKKLGGRADATDLSSELELPISSIFSLSSLLSAKGFVRVTETVHKEYSLTKEGLYCFNNGLPETRMLNYLSANGGSAPLASLDTILKSNEVSAALGWGRRSGAIAIEKRGSTPTITIKQYQKPDLEELVKRIGNYREITFSDPKELESLQILLQRGLIMQKETAKISLQMIREPEPNGIILNALTSDIIKSGKWREVKLRPYDVTASPPLLNLGKKHPYLEFLEEVKEILFAMGFEEKSGPYVENEFWNFDALFQAQHHPARAVHDSFHIVGVTPTIDAPPSLIHAVKSVHENGGDTGSSGWGYNWDLEIARQPVLRTQTTSVSIRSLFELKAPPVKTFCLSKVFRPDLIDSRHMVEFCQLDGILGDMGINVKNLLGILTEFGKQLGFREIKFTPGYFPFTEPSIEAYVKHPKLGWIECLGSGLFRPEVLTPLGIDFPVIAWGIGIDRLAMIKLGLDDIRELNSMNLEALRRWGWW